MVFYKIEIEYLADETEEKISSKESRARAAMFAEKSEDLFHKSHEETMIFGVNLNSDVMIFAGISKIQDEIDSKLKPFLKDISFQVQSIKTQEITYNTFENLLRAACRNGYINDDDAILKNFEIQDLHSRCRHHDFGETIIDGKEDIEDLKNIADAFLFGGTLNPELDRIYEGKKNIKAIGHPVHYLLSVDDRDTRKIIYKSLLSALYSNGRIKNKRYAYFDIDSESCFPDASVEALYHASEGGAIVIRYTNFDEAENSFAKRSTDLIAAFCEFAVKHKNNVLTIICIPSKAKKIKDDFLINWENTTFIELHEDLTFKNTAEKYLKNKASKYKIKCDSKLMNMLEENKGYTASELNRIFDAWHTNKLKNNIYPQYKSEKTVRQKIASDAPKGTAYEKLEKLIGLSSAKEVMNNALNYFKAQKLFADRGMIAERPSMHMVFTGNPGTAKTTVARLFAEIMKENGLVENGDMYEVGRADLVGKYVGSTAPLVKSAFKRAKGGVLFIDEAYSLVDGKEGLFGDEAINTIVQEMENNRKDTIVIFAGYSDKMEGFLNKNPGLRSRIAFHIPFEDYSVDELCDIAKHIAEEKKLTLSPNAIIKLENVFESACQSSDFGNGRFARNIIEKAKMAQAGRLMKMDFESITDECLRTITAEDIETPKEKVGEKIIKIGFSA